METIPFSNEMYHNDLGPTLNVGGLRATAVYGEQITMLDYGAGFEIWRFRMLTFLGVAIPGRCSTVAERGKSWTDIGYCGGDATCDGVVCTRTGVPCTTASDCTDPPEFCDTCVESTANIWRVHLSMYGTYDSGLSPVHSGLLVQQEFDTHGVWAANAPGYGYFNNLDPAPGTFIVPQASVFYVVESKAVPLGGSLATRPRGPSRRSTSVAAASSRLDTDNGYTDVDGDAILTPADEILPFANAGCAGGICRINHRLFISGPPNPNLIDPGPELYGITGNGDTYVDLACSCDEFNVCTGFCAGWFDYGDLGEDCNGGIASDAVFTRSVLTGANLATNVGTLPGYNLQAVFERSTGVVPPGNDAFTVASFQAHSLAPITVMRGGVPELWDVLVCKGGVASTGVHHLAARECDGEGFPLTTDLFLAPKLTFVRQGDNCTITANTGLQVPMTSQPYRTNPTPTACHDHVRRRNRVRPELQRHAGHAGRGLLGSVLPRRVHPALRGGLRVRHGPGGPDLPVHGSRMGRRPHSVGLLG